MILNMMILIICLVTSLGVIMVILKYLNSSLGSANRFLSRLEIGVPAKTLNNLNKERMAGWLSLIMIPLLLFLLVLFILWFSRRG